MASNMGQQGSRIVSQDPQSTPESLLGELHTDMKHVAIKSQDIR